VLAAHRAQRLIQPGEHQAGAPFQRGVASSIGKWANCGEVKQLHGLTNPPPEKLSRR
jgi:hypothetical protein